MNYKVFTSESVASGHPDKICDQISDAIVDVALSTDPNAHCGIEALVTTNHVTVAGEVKIKNGAKLDYEKITREVIKDLGYTNPKFGFSDKATINCLIHQQSREIALGVDTGGAGDQGMMFGYAVNETPDLMPLPIALAHKLVERLDQVREEKILPYLKPDGKSEVTLEYNKGKPVFLERVVLAACHDEKIKNADLKEDLYKLLVTPVLEPFNLKIYQKDLIVNGTGVWTTPGPASDTGVTGRKIMVDSYGAFGRAGGGCFSGKDPTKVDRSGAYAARYIAKNIVAAHLANKVEVQIAYVIGQRDPIAKDIETFGTERKPHKVIRDFAWRLIDLSVPGIIDGLNLRHPIYRETARYGHFGRNSFPWEKIKT
ncbi:MAG: methionine adenosyltransferase [Candidatus Woykebacteria bacterium RBG_16_44_10]|uniref:Methionine adenosyltransferase n=1 Tax=Candidatus Woykebacteria bacterium RBG_16_44_10 TaxID=1802597 RepID=A0A1G1WCN3_9BACT|nr:MAG: methionine adenosyltransferase [Candidatus Woykebacteria bacterium RBG_16_44_10]